ncbi:hypothetical protein FPV67DRAFT_1669970 [Lyophyllum atratum]|nr:hypothetical protein FPV67DRAFT_1669970 [Lyophyllum atratum]
MEYTGPTKEHVRSSSSSSSLMSTVGQRIASAIPGGHSKSDKSGPPSAKSSPHQSPQSTPVLSYSKPKKAISRTSSLERILGAPHSSESRSSSPMGEHLNSLAHKIKRSPRPWTSSPKKLIPAKEQTEGWHHTRLRVARAVSPMIDIAVDVAYEVLAHGAELLKFSPIPGLEGVAKLLLGIWNTLQQVEANWLACLRLAERCADILSAIYEEVSRAGRTVARVLSEPLENLEHAFEQVQKLLQSQMHRPFVKRLLKRDEDLANIADCNTSLQDALGHFDRSIQLKILDVVTGVHESPSAGKSTDEIHKRIREIQERQNERDRSGDIADLEYIYVKAQTAETDAEALEILGIEKPDIPDAVKTLLRILEQLRSHHVFKRLSTSLPSPPRSSTWPVDGPEAKELGLLDRAFIERELRALQSAYKGVLPVLPSWTITKFEVDLYELIGRGFFSTVYRGSWHGRSVAVKVLEVHTSNESFVNEINVWKMLTHRHVLEMYGASSAEGPMPWFLVSPLMRHGSVTDYLKRVDWEVQRYREAGDGVAAAMSMKDKVNHLRMIHDIAEGMNYLHECGVYHGDLKGANVLVGENLRCVVSDFGQSKWKADIRQGNPLPNHAVRWQAPELMGGRSLLSKKSDVYAFAMCCVEILTMGSIPWPTMNDDAVKEHVINEQGRPPYPASLVHSLGLEEFLPSIWHQAPSERPSFKKLVVSLEVIRAQVRVLTTPALASPRITVSEPNTYIDHLASSLQFSPDSEGLSESPSSPQAQYSTPSITVLPKHDSLPDVVFDDESDTTSPLDNSLLLFDTVDDDTQPPPSMMNDAETIKVRQEILDNGFEFTYRVCLSHEFPRSVNVPLWTPGDVALGDIGYLTRDGHFVKLFNSINPGSSSGGRLKEMHGISHFGRVSIARRQERDTNLVRKGLEAFSKFMSPGDGRPLDRVKRRHTFSLSGARTAFLCAEKTTHNYIEDSKACKQWLKDHWQWILREFGSENALQKEDLMLIVETLTAQNYALLVNHGHLDDQGYFDVFSTPGTEEPWGSFTIPSEEDDMPG